MEKVLVYENDQVNEYEIEFDQEYMNILLDEYRKRFSNLREERLLSFGKCSKDSIFGAIRYFDEVVSFDVSTTEIEDAYLLKFICSVSPAAFHILKDEKNNFSLNNNKMHSLLFWVEALSHRDEEHSKRKVCSFAPVNDFLGEDEGYNTVENITNLLEDVTFVYSGKKESPSIFDVEKAKVAAKFVDKFNINKAMPKELKKGV